MHLVARLQLTTFAEHTDAPDRLIRRKNPEGICAVGEFEVSLPMEDGDCEFEDLTGSRVKLRSLGFDDNDQNPAAFVSNFQVLDHPKIFLLLIVSERAF